MSKDANLLITVARLSKALADRQMHRYSHAKSPHKFTQSQLLTCLVLRAYLKTTYRGVVEVLSVSDRLRRCLRLKGLPHYSTLKRFADRAVTARQIDALLERITQAVLADRGRPVELAMDATGLESGSASTYFQTRSGRARQRWVKLSVCVLCGSLIPAGLVVGWGPCNDKTQAMAVLEKTRAACGATTPRRLFADAGYDASYLHAYCRDDWGVASWIKPAVHRRDGRLNGEHRSKMTPRRLKANGYGRRWHVEAFFSGLKRTMGWTLQARQTAGMFTEAAIRVLAYALRR